ncbi:MAG: glycosyltransferase [Actinobacteria bacterium]|nr:glycosyltransferase [Actinomycetota bacterium]MBI3686601.1 glycosyltransferase [Actinomycetota bacterium]
MTGPTRAPTTVIIPAHNEAAVLARGLTAMLETAEPGEFEVIVVSNGSTDATAAVARSFARDRDRDRDRDCDRAITVIELAEASKTAAVRAGAARAAGRVQVVVDADVLLPTGVLRDLAAALHRADGSPRVACPRVDVDATGASPLVRGYYRAWARLPYLSSGTIGSGVFGLTVAGADRLGELPDVINDDGWVRRAFAPGERITTPGAFTVLAPRTLPALVRRRARIAIGNRDLAAAWGDDPGGNSPRALLAATRSGAVSWPDCAAFGLVTALARGLAWWRRRTGNRSAWSTDRTSREGTVTR